MIGIGDTPLLRLCGVEKAYALSVKLYAKAEYTNAGGSIKDRVALRIVEDAEKAGKLKNGATMIEATSGNTGIGLAMVAALKGYRCIIVMPETMSLERREEVERYGALLVLTDGKAGMQGAVERAQEIARYTPNAFLAKQFENPSNPLAHYDATAREIYQACPKVDVFVTGVGTGGTLTGVGRFFKEQNARVRVVAVEPAQSPLLSKGICGVHNVQGIGPNFIPPILDKSLIDEVLTVDETQSILMGKALYHLDGVDVGISSGANVLGAIAFAKRRENFGKTIVTIFPDGGGRYASIYKNI